MKEKDANKKKTFTPIKDEVRREFLAKENGAILPTIFYDTPSEIQINREQLIIILEEEQKLRTSESVIEKYDKHEIFDYGMLDRDIRINALKHKLPGILQKSESEIDWDDALKAYELSCGEYINDPEIKEIVVWMKYDKTRLGNLKKGDDVITDGINLYGINDLSKHSFKDLLSTTKPNILVAGSLTWPPFRLFGVDTLNEIYNNYVVNDKVNLIVVYISEAHARDEWPLSNKFVIKQHKTLEDRRKAVEIYLSNFNVSYKSCIYLDEINITNDLKFPCIEKVYSCWPERGYIFSKNMKIEYIAMAQIEDLVRWAWDIPAWLKENVV